MTRYYVWSPRGAVYHDKLFQHLSHPMAPMCWTDWPRQWASNVLCGTKPPRNRRLCLRCAKLRLARRPSGGAKGAGG